MISHSQRCIFIHIPKTAGQSIEHVFLAWNGLTWDQRAALLLRENKDPSKGPPRLAHLTASDYLRHGYVTQDQFQTYFKFAFVRNPWARMVSIYKHLSYGVSFRHYVLHEFRKVVWKEMYWFVRPQKEFVYNEDGDLCVDFLGRFERLQEDFYGICERLGMPPTPLPHVNRGQEHWQKRRPSFHPRKMLRYLRKRHYRRPAPSFSHWREYYDEATRALVADLYHEDIALFGYRFEV